MPRYEFECGKCGSRVEISKSINDNSTPLCCEETCAATPMTQIISLSSFHLKGLGWSAEGYSKSGID